jgi:hypothetical protein
MLKDWFAIDKEKWVNTGCVDCGEIYSHPQPISNIWSRNFKTLFSDVNMTVYEDKIMKHFYIILHTLPNEKSFLSCKQPFHRPVTATEFSKIMNWINLVTEEK